MFLSSYDEDKSVKNGKNNYKHGLLLHVPCQHSLRYLGPKLWNSLPSNLRNLPALQSFKRQIRLRQSFTGTQRQNSSKPLEHSIVKRILVFKR